MAVKLDIFSFFLDIHQIARKCEDKWSPPSIGTPQVALAA